MGSCQLMNCVFSNPSSGVQLACVVHVASGRVTCASFRLIRKGQWAAQALDDGREKPGRRPGRCTAGRLTEHLRGHTGTGRTLACTWLAEDLMCR